MELREEGKMSEFMGDKLGRKTLVGIGEDI